MEKSLVVAMAMALGVTASAYAANPFSDVPAGHWAYDSISKLAAAGVIEGYGDDTFRGDRLMTRYEMAQIVAKAMAKGANVDKLAAEFADELDALGVRVAALEKKSDNVKVTGAVRYSYEIQKYNDANKQWVRDAAGNKLHKNDRDERGRLRTRITVNGTVNDNWTYRATLENTQEFRRALRPYVDNAGEEETKLHWAYLDGRLGGANVQAGRFYIYTGDGNVYDGCLDGVQASYGTKNVSLNAYVGKATQHNDDWGYADIGTAYGAEAKFAFGKRVNLTVGYDKFNVKDGDDVGILNANLYGKIANKVGLGAMYLHSKSDNKNIIADGASKNGFVVTADIAGASFGKPGSWGIQGKYYHAPAGSAVAHTMTSTAAGLFFNEGYKGYSIGAKYTIAKGMRLGLTWFDIRSRNTDKKQKTLWSEMEIRF